MEPWGPLVVFEFNGQVKVGTDFDGLILVYDLEDWSFDNRLM